MPRVCAHARQTPRPWPLGTTATRRQLTADGNCARVSTAWVFHLASQNAGRPGQHVVGLGRRAVGHRVIGHRWGPHVTSTSGQVRQSRARTGAGVGVAAWMPASGSCLSQHTLTRVRHRHFVPCPCTRACVCVSPPSGDYFSAADFGAPPANQQRRGNSPPRHTQPAAHDTVGGCPSPPPPPPTTVRACWHCLT